MRNNTWEVIGESRQQIANLQISNTNFITLITSISLDQLDYVIQYKIISRVMTNKEKSIFDLTICKVRGSFVKRSQILD